MVKLVKKKKLVVGICFLKSLLDSFIDIFSFVLF